MSFNPGFVPGFCISGPTVAFVLPRTAWLLADPAPSLRWKPPRLGLAQRRRSVPMPLPTRPQITLFCAG